MTKPGQRQSQSYRAIIISCIAVLIIGIAAFFLIIFMTPKQEVSQVALTQAAWSEDICEKTFGSLASEGLITLDERKQLPIVTVAGDKPDFGSAEANERYVDNIGFIQGKIAIVFDVDAFTDFTEYVSDRVFGYRNNDEGAPMPFDAKVYATKTDECDTLIVIRSVMTRTAAQYGEGDRGDAATFVFIIDAREKTLIHVEFIGEIMPSYVPPARGSSENPLYIYGLPGEAMLYIGTLTEGRAVETDSGTVSSWRDLLPPSSPQSSQPEGSRIFADMVPAGGELVADEWVIRDRLGISLPGEEYYGPEQEFYVVGGDTACGLYYEPPAFLTVMAKKTRGYEYVGGDDSYVASVSIIVDGDTRSQEALIRISQNNGLEYVEFPGTQELRTEGYELRLSVNPGEGGRVSWYNPNSGVSCSITVKGYDDPNGLVQTAETFIEAQNR
jgi:hypothetical protein